MINDSISSNKTRPDEDRQIGRDQSAVMMAAPGHGVLSLIDNREVSPAPVSHFKTKRLQVGQGSIDRNAEYGVSQPFHYNRSSSFKAISTLEKLQYGNGTSSAAGAADEEDKEDGSSKRLNLKFSSGMNQNTAANLNNSSKLHHLSIPQLLNGHGGSSTSAWMRSSSQNDSRFKRTRSSLNMINTTKKNLFGLHTSRLSTVSNEDHEAAL